MAVDYWHRVLVEGALQGVQALRTRMHREYPRTVSGQTWMEVVPFSFAALYELAPAVRRSKPEVPCDPYELSVWPLRRKGRTKAEIRYQFQTRNLEMTGLLRPLSRAVPSLTFTLITHCFDDSSMETYRFSAGEQRRWKLPERQQEFHWDRARKKFGLSGDSVYEDSEARGWAEDEMLLDALRHWSQGTPVAIRRRRYRYDWWNRPRLRDLDGERTLVMLEVANVTGAEPRHRRRLASRRAPHL